MKIFITGILSLTICASLAQTNIYHPFPDSGAVWNIFASGCCTASCPGPINDPVIDDFTFSYFISGDTLVNGFTYHKLYRSGSHHQHCVLGSSINNWNFFNNELAGAYRQDTAAKQVYLLASFNQECLLYDFDLNVGDTLKGDCMNWGSCAVVTSIDSILVGLNYRNRYNFNGGIMNYSLIEGIGSTSGLLEPICPFEYFGNLICFSQNSQILFPDTSTVCNNFTTLNEIRPKHLLKIFPNPFLSSTTIQTNHEFVITAWELYNSIGQRVKWETANTNTFSLDRNNLPNGLYIIQLYNPSGVVLSQRIVIE